MKRHKLDRHGRSRSRRRRVAIHEAGHAVAHVILNREIHHVTIRPDRKDGSDGHVQSAEVAHSCAIGADPGWVCIDEIICSWAGSVAEKIVLGDIDEEGAGADRLDALDWARRASPDGGGPVDSPLVTGLCNVAAQECTRLIKRHRDSVIAVADALLERETLSAADVTDLVWGPLHPVDDRPPARVRKLDPDLVATVRDTIEEIKSLGHTIPTLPFPPPEEIAENVVRTRILKSQGLRP